MAHKLHWTYLSKQTWLISISVQQDLFDRNNTKDKAEETTQSPDGWGQTKESLSTASHSRPKIYSSVSAHVLYAFI